MKTPKRRKMHFFDLFILSFANKSKEKGRLVKKYTYSLELSTFGMIICFFFALEKFCILRMHLHM